MTSLLITAPILLTLTLLVSGLAKLGARRGTEDAMTSLRLPLRSFHRSVATLLPVAEIVLALVLWVPSAPLQTMIAVLIALLMLTYLAIIARALQQEEVAECACFGTLASPTVSLTTLGRNILLSALGVLTVLSAGSGLMERVMVQQPLVLVGAGAALLTAIGLTALVLGGTAPREEQAEGEAPGQDPAEEGAVLDYERVEIPPAVLQRPDSGLTTLRRLAAQRAVLLLFVSEGCGPCERVLDQVPGWVEQLSAFMDVRVALSRPLDQLRERTRERVGDRALHDLQFSARSALGARSAPSAVLLGADGLLAGGPVDGGSAVIEFVEEILGELSDAQHEGRLPGPGA